MLDCSEALGRVKGPLAPLAATTPLSRPAPFDGLDNYRTDAAMNIRPCGGGSKDQRPSARDRLKTRRRSLVFCELWLTQSPENIVAGTCRGSGAAIRVPNALFARSCIAWDFASACMVASCPDDPTSCFPDMVSLCLYMAASGIDIRIADSRTPRRAISRSGCGSSKKT